MSKIILLIALVFAISDLSAIPTVETKFLRVEDLRSWYWWLSNEQRSISTNKAVISVKNLPNDCGDLTLQRSLCLWEQISQSENNKKSPVFLDLDLFVSKNGKRTLISKTFGISSLQCTNQLDTQYFMLGEKAKVRLFNKEKTWIDCIEFTPKPLDDVSGDRKISAELLDIVPLIYRIHFSGFEKGESVELTTKTALRSSKTSNFIPDRNGNQFTLLFMRNEKKLTQPHIFEVTDKDNTRLQLKLPTGINHSQNFRDQLQQAKS